MDDAAKFDELLAALAKLGARCLPCTVLHVVCVCTWAELPTDFTSSERTALFSILSAILELGTIDFEPVRWRARSPRLGVAD